MSGTADVHRVCVVSPLYHPSLGGLGRQAQLLTERLSREGVSVSVIARRMKGMPDAVYAPAVRVHRAWSFLPYVHTYEKVGIRNILISLSFSLSCMFLLVLFRSRYTIVHFHGASLPLFLNLPVLKLMGKKVVAKVAGTGLGLEAGSLRGRYFGIGNLMTRVFRMADCFVATTSEIENKLKEDGFAPERIRRIPNFIDTSGTAGGESPAARAAEAQPVVVFSGRMIEPKGVGHLLDAWRIVQDATPGCRLVLLGEGPLLKTLKVKARDLGIAESVRFRGHVDDVYPHLREADIFVLPSLQEGMPNALLEAMSCGLASIATRIGGIPDIIQDGTNGVLVAPGDAEGLARGILMLANDRERLRAIGSQAYATVRQRYRLEGVIPRYLDLYARLRD